MKYIATVIHCDQVSPEHGQFFTSAKAFVGNETIDDAMRWAKKVAGRKVNLTIVEEED